MESITIKNDIKKLIEKHMTADLPPYKIEFIPYMSNYEASKKELDSFPIQEETKQSIRQFISNVFFKESTIDVKLIINMIDECFGKIKARRNRSNCKFSLFVKTNSNRSN